MLRTTKTERGEWRVVGTPFVVGKSPEPPRYREPQEWLISHVDDPDGYIAAGYKSKTHALVCLEVILTGTKAARENRLQPIQSVTR